MFDKAGSIGYNDLAIAGRFDMLLKLSEIINVPGGAVPFDCEVDVGDTGNASVKGFASPVRAVGSVRNSAGGLTLECVITADMLCICDRCCTEFRSLKEQEVRVFLSAELEDEDNPDIFPLTDDCADLDAILTTCFLFELETKFLCREDCAGLCMSCGANLNDGPCGCQKETDPRLAVLKQLLD